MDGAVSPRVDRDASRQEQVKKSLQGFLDSGTFQNMCFHGPSGTGKTSAAYAFLKKVLPHMTPRFFLKLDVASISTANESIKAFVAGPHKNLRVILIDEAETLSLDVQYALKRVMEELCETVRFVFICNNIAAIDSAIQSRCFSLSFSPLDILEIRNFLLSGSRKNRRAAHGCILAEICSRQDIHCLERRSALGPRQFSNILLVFSSVADRR
jgi:DNA polymerase III delta prime subunit